MRGAVEWGLFGEGGTSGDDLFNLDARVAGEGGFGGLGVEAGAFGFFEEVLVVDGDGVDVDVTFGVAFFEVGGFVLVGFGVVDFREGGFEWWASFDGAGWFLGGFLTGGLVEDEGS